MPDEMNRTPAEGTEARRQPKSFVEDVDYYVLPFHTHDESGDDTGTLPNFECARCQYSTTEADRMREHLAKGIHVHGGPRTKEQAIDASKPLFEGALAFKR